MSEFLPQASVMPVIRFKDVAKSYRKEKVLQGINLDVKRGELIGLLGVNGAGKTTLIKSLLDFTHLDSGTIDIDGIDHRRAEARRALAFLPERFTPPYYLSGKDFLTYALKLQGLQMDEARAAAMLGHLDLKPAALGRPVRTYSKGMTQKLGLIACFLARKPLYILDEPMSGLDPKARTLLKAQLQQRRDEGSTVFFSSHSLADVEEVCDRMAILHGGQLRFVGTTAECRERYGMATLEQAFMACIS